MKVAVDYPEFQFAVGARKDFEKMILDDLGGNAQWGAKGPKMVIWDKQFDSFRYVFNKMVQFTNYQYEITLSDVFIQKIYIYLGWKSVKIVILFVTWNQTVQTSARL